MTYPFMEKVKDLGFVSVGLSKPESPLFLDPFRRWLEAGKQGQMTWLSRHPDIREDPKMLLEGCKTIISMAYPYSPQKPSTPDGFFAARYSEPAKPDYHDRLRRLCRELTRNIETHYPGSKSRVCVDSAPILERSFALGAGVGFIGKNNMLIVPGYGSYSFLAEILTTVEFPLLERPVMKDQCGDCARCVEACPTGALEGPHSMDASKCLSYLTIEYEGAIDDNTARHMGNCFLGCDICQEVCPFNEKPISGDISLPTTDHILGMDEEDFERTLGKTAFGRAGLKKIKRNLEVIRFRSSPH